MSRTILLAATAFAAFAVPSIASAQDTGGYPPGTPVSEVERRERAETERLNQEMLAQDAAVAAANAAAVTQGADAQAQYEADLAARQAEHQAQVDAAEAARRQYEADLAAYNRRYGRPQ